MTARFYLTVETPTGLMFWQNAGLSREFPDAWLYASLTEAQAAAARLERRGAGQVTVNTHEVTTDE